MCCQENRGWRENRRERTSFPQSLQTFMKGPKRSALKVEELVASKPGSPEALGPCRRCSLVVWAGGARRRCSNPPPRPFFFFSLPRCLGEGVRAGGGGEGAGHSQPLLRVLVPAGGGGTAWDRALTAEAVSCAPPQPSPSSPVRKMPQEHA